MFPADDLAAACFQLTTLRIAEFRSLSGILGSIFAKIYFLRIPYPQPVLKTSGIDAQTGSKSSRTFPLKIFRIVEYLIDYFVKHMAA
jgi:hypothetical protein